MEFVTSWIAYIVRVLLGTTLTSSLGTLLLLTLALWFFSVQVRRGHVPSLRPIPGYDRIVRMMREARESGQPIHLSMGLSGLGGKLTPEALVGLTVLDHLSREMAISGNSPLVSLADPTLLPLANDMTRESATQYIPSGEGRLNKVRYIAPQAIAYAAGVMGLLERERLAGNVLVGSFGDEYLLMGEVGAEKGIQQVGGTSNLQTLPFVYTSADDILVGEEIFAAGAYLSAIGSHIASLMAQDLGRVCLALAIIAGVILKTMGS